MKTLSAGSFVRWSSEDKEGKFSHVGQVVSHEDGNVVFSNELGGEMSVPETEGSFRAVKQPKTWKKSVVATVKKIASGAVRRVKGQTKGALVIALFESEKPTTRKEAIALIVKAGLMSEKGASTYASNANKAMQIW